MLADAIKKKNLGTVTKNKIFRPPSTTISNDKQSTSFWNTLMKKINVEAPTLASNDGRPPVIHIHLPPPFTKIETTTKMPSVMPITEAKEVEPIEAEDTTTTAKPTTSAVPSTTSASPSYKLQIHTDENGVNKISIIQEAPVNTSKQIDNSTKTVDKTNSACSPKSPLFYCQGVDVFQNVSSISAWCVGKCIQGECVKSVCNCSCHAAKTEEDSMHDDIALLFKGTGKEFSTDLVKMFKGLYDSLKGAKSKDVSMRPAETKQPKKENVTTFKETNGPNEMKSLLSSIERLIDAKLHQSGFNNKGPEEVEAEDVPMGSQNSGNGNVVSVNSIGHEQNYQNDQNTQNSNFGPPDGGNNNWNNNNNNNNNNGRNNWGNDNGRNNWNNNNNGQNGNWNNNNNNNFSPGNNWQNNGNNGNNGWNNGNNGWNRGNSNNGWSNGQMGNWNSGPPPPQMPWQGNSQQGWGGPSMSRGPQWNPWMSGPQGWQRGPQSMWGPGSMGMGMGGGMWGMGFGGMGKSKGSGGEAAD
ncbi:hypothetical protein FSP39_004836 [Pinctada imbricata]|uniref:Uncharacterized protein n=1 Tax=Pinctada imbricata TaxID=66713 RepID=A0AA89BT22_PINIB|nr:hypothetical protein FSP39_004836 [Pinctada imbricata]